MPDEWNHDVTAAAKMALALAECPPEQRSDTLAFVVKLWLEHPGVIAMMNKRKGAGLHGE